MDRTAAGSGTDAAVPSAGGEGTSTDALVSFRTSERVNVEMRVPDGRRRSSASSPNRSRRAAACGRSLQSGPSRRRRRSPPLPGRWPRWPGARRVVALWPLFAPLAVDRDLVVFDQRGTGHSKPALTCDNIMVATDAGESDFVTACRNDLAAKVVSLSHFDSASSATDINDLRVALGYPAWDLFGISYGTRLALTVLRDYPDSVRSIVIDSVLPPANRRARRSREECQPRLRRHLRLVRFAAGLPARFSRRCARTFTTPSRRSRQSPRQSRWTAAVSSPSRPTSRSISLRVFSYSADAIPIVPELIDDLHRENYSIMKQILSAASSASSGGLALGMDLSVVCRGMAPFSSRQAIARSQLRLAARAGDPLHCEGDAQSL